ncbi:phosphoribosylglycinamide formyltransferase [Patescibacteria group bacterium]|nr:phosphoribosylglycinamide formyltransferase [Patescibacteria group bacterium]
MKKIAVLISGSGTNLQSIIDKQSNYVVSVVVSNKEDAYGLERAKKAGIPAFAISHKGLEREEHEKKIIEVLDKYDIDLVVLAGYMRILSEYFVDNYKGRLINIHPALLPSFPGTDGYGDSFEYGVKVSGCTIHFVDAGVDTGPIIIQRVNEIREDDTLESFKERGLKIEHEALPEAIKLFCDDKLKIEERRVRIKENEKK